MAEKQFKFPWRENQKWVRWQTIAMILSAALTLVALGITIRNTYQTRQLFVLQNKPYLDIKSVCWSSGTVLSINFFNSGNKAADITQVRVEIKNAPTLIDTTIIIELKVWPKESESFEYFCSSLPEDLIYEHRLNYSIQLKYDCDELQLKDVPISSYWQYDIEKSSFVRLSNTR
jgi:hypothetical protein